MIYILLWLLGAPLTLNLVLFLRGVGRYPSEPRHRRPAILARDISRAPAGGLFCRDHRARPR